MIYIIILYCNEVIFMKFVFKIILEKEIFMFNYKMKFFNLKFYNLKFIIF